VGVKASQFSFSRLQKADPVLGVDMVSTGEVGCIGDGYYEAILKSMLSVGYSVPKKAVLISSGPTRSKIELLESARMLAEMGLKIYATGGTHDFLASHGVESEMLYWPDSGKKPNVTDYLREKKIDLVINVPKNLSKSELDNDYSIRRNAVDFNIPLITNARLASAFIYSVCKVKPEEVGIKAWEEY
jgi:carbamoyl-phosphate synthase large subunit